MRLGECERSGRHRGEGEQIDRSGRRIFFMSNEVIGIMGISQFIWHATSVINISIGQNSDGRNY